MEELRRSWQCALDAPEPGQDVDSENGDSGSGGDAGESFLGSRFPVRKPVAADHDRDQACDLGDGSGEEGLEGSKAGVEGMIERELQVARSREAKEVTVSGLPGECGQHSVWWIGLGLDQNTT